MSNTTSTKDQSVNTEQFWDSVSKVYSSNDMTNHMADFELQTSLSYIKAMNVEGLSSFGVADGNRDPIQILKHLNDNDRQLPNELVVNDISSNMVKETANNLLLGGWTEKIKSINYIHCPISQIKSINSEIKNKSPLYCIGVYNVDYIKESLELYRQNKEIIGKNFTVNALYLTFDENNNPVIIHGISLMFNIDHYNNALVGFNALKTDPSFYAFSVTTDNNFVSHYFNSEKLNLLLNNIFKGLKVITEKGADANAKRYIVNIISDNDINKKPNYVVTMLNNVLGNIKSEDQIVSLQKLFDLFR